MTTRSLFKSKLLTPEEASAEGYEGLHVDLGEPSLCFTTYVRQRSLLLARKNVASIARAGVATLASIHVPERKEAFSVSIDAFAFDFPIEAQPCADYALALRGYKPVPETEQRSLFIGGSIGLIEEDGRSVRAARTYAVVRGRIVLCVVMEFPIEGSDEALMETGAFVSNIVFDDGNAPGFGSNDVTTLTIPLPEKPFDLAYPANWTVTANGFKDVEPPGTVQFAVGDLENPNGLMTFGFHDDGGPTDQASLDAWGERIAKLYVAENPTILAEPKRQISGQIKQLADTNIKNAFYIFYIDNLKFHRENQIRVIVVAEGERRFTLTMVTDSNVLEDFIHFLVYGVGITAHEMMVDSLLRYLTGRSL